MKYLKTFEEIYKPTKDELKQYRIKIGDYVISNNDYSGFTEPFFIKDLVKNEIGKVNSIFISNRGYLNEQVYCEIIYNDIPYHISKHISNEPFTFKHSVAMHDLRKVTPEEYKEWKLKKKADKYNL